MKLQTSIKARRDGVVNLVGASGARYVFTADAQGDLCAEIADPADLSHLLTLGDFFPADVADNEQAMALVQAVQAGEVDDDDDGDDDDQSDPNAPPLEAATPPGPAKAAKDKHQGVRRAK